MAEPTPAPKIRQLFISALFGVFLSIVTTVVLLMAFVIPRQALHESRIAALEERLAALEGDADEDDADDAEDAPAAPPAVEVAPAAVDAGTP